MYIIDVERFTKSKNLLEMWTIYRRYSQFNKLDTYMRKHKLPVGMKLPPKKKDKFNPETIKAREEAFRQYLNSLTTMRSTMRDEEVKIFFENHQLGDTRITCNYYTENIIS